jgi:hypothetical protein
MDAPVDFVDQGQWPTDMPVQLQARVIPAPAAPVRVSGQGRPTYIYDGGPRNFIPTPDAAPMRAPAVQPDGRQVSTRVPAPQYLAYGEKAQPRVASDTLRLVLGTAQNESNDLLQVAYPTRTSNTSIEGGSMIHVQLADR